jgi:serine phosphatase RsbU (regulator of sigma subunit)
MKWVPSFPDQFRQEPAKFLLVGVFKTLAIVLLPAFLFGGLNQFFIRQRLVDDKHIQQSEMARLLADIAGLADPQQRFNRLFKELADIPFPSETFSRRLKQIIADAPDTFDIYFFDTDGKCLVIDHLPRPPKFVAQKFMAAVKDPEQAEKDEKWLVQFSGYKKAHVAIAGSVGTIVKIGRSDDRQWGGIFPLKSQKQKPAGDFVVFIRKSAVKQDDFLFEAVLDANVRFSRNFIFAWWDPLAPAKILPVSAGMATETLSILEKLPFGQAVFEFQGRQGYRSFTESGISLLAMARYPLDPPALSVYVGFTIKIAAALAFIVLLPVFLGITTFRPGLKVKITAILLFGAGSCMIALLFTGVIDRSDREKVLTSRYQVDNIDELKRIDEGLVFEYKRIERLLKSRIRRIEKLPEEEFGRESRLFWRNLTAFADRFKELVIVSSSTSLLFRPESEDPLPDCGDNSAAMYGDMILQTYQGRYVAPDNEAQSHNLKDVIHNSSAAFSRNFILKGGRFENLSLADNSVPTYIDFFLDLENQGRAILLAFLSKAGIQRNYLLEVSRLFDEKRGKNQPRLVALPVVASINWPAFPKRSSAENLVLKTLAAKAASSDLPVHQRATINGRSFLLSALKGKNLDGYILILARPYNVIGARIAGLNKSMQILAISVILLAVILAWLTSKLLLRPISKLRNVLSEITKGNFRVSLATETVAEFNQVAMSLNRTLESFHEMKVASNIQEHLWPEKGLKGQDWELEGACKTATELGGDHFDWFELPDGRILITIGDVTGHGIGAAMVQASIKVWIALKASNCEDSATLLDQINRLHCAYGAKRLPMAFWAAYYFPDTGKLDYASAGQTYPILVNTSGEIVALKQPGIPLGIRAKNQYNKNEIFIDREQKLVLYTDGIVETADKNGKVIGFDGLEKIVSQLGALDSHALIEKLFDVANEWGEQIDDRTVVVLSRSASE